MANVFRADQVGGLVKPRALLAAEAASVAGSLDASGLAAACDAAVQEVLVMQKKTGITVVSDGEFRRVEPDSPYSGAIAGIQRRKSSDSRDSEGWRSPYCVGAELRQERRLAAQEAAFLQGQTKLPYKISLLAPSALALRMFEPGVTDRIYPSLTALAKAFAEIVAREIEALGSEGVRYIQLSSPAYAWLHDAASRSRIVLPGQALDTAFDELLAVDVGMLERVKVPAGAAIGLHVGRYVAGDPAADTYERMLEGLLPVVPVDRFLLEYASPQPHDFSSLRRLPAGKIAVLGLVSTDSPSEEVDAILDRLDQAATCTEEHNLAISPRRSFANSAHQAPEALLDLQRRSLERTSEVVQRVWGLEL